MLLSQIGHTVVHTKNGSEAIEAFISVQTKHSAFDCVIPDLTIASGMGAEPKIKRMCEIDPSVKAILTNGCTAHPVPDDFKGNGFHSLLKKPFTTEG
jgi:hypothetical protein